MIVKSWSFYKIEILIISILLSISNLTGCNKKLDAPEVIDPIYNELLKDQKRLEKEDSEAKKLLSDKLLELEKAPVGSIVRVRTLKEINQTKEKIEFLAQDLHYIELRIEKRKYLDRETYLRSLEANIPWPDPEDYQKFLANRRLRSAPRVWDARVPKIGERYTNKPIKAAKNEGKE